MKPETKVRTLFILCATLVACGQGEPAPVTIEATGVLTAESPVDSNHMNFHYTVHTFQGERWDRVNVELLSADFPVLLKLVETATGAPLAEWDQEYSEETSLSYTIAGPGEYQVRVYSMAGSGEYTVNITLKPGGSR
ncbi:MAG: hypothetical protein R6V62_11275 [Candidatus Fermentibacteraceae bacterium]